MSRKTMQAKTMQSTTPVTTPISALLGNALLSLAAACRDIRSTARAG